MPHGNFDKPPETMKRSSDGETVEACGPISWEGDESDGGPAQRVTVTHVDIRQPSSGAHAQGDRENEFQRPASDWMVDPELRAQGSQKFVDGPAEAFALAEVQLDNGQIRHERWPKNGPSEVLLSAEPDGDS